MGERIRKLVGAEDGETAVEHLSAVAAAQDYIGCGLATAKQHQLQTYAVNRFMSAALRDEEEKEAMWRCGGDLNHTLREEASQPRVR